MSEWPHKADLPNEHVMDILCLIVSTKIKISLLWLQKIARTLTTEIWNTIFQKKQWIIQD